MAGYACFMKPLFHPQLINGRSGDPGLLVTFAFERRTLLFDLGENGSVSARTLLGVSHAFVSHTHMDHFVGLDRIVRLRVGRGRGLQLYGPPGFIEQVGHKLAAYTWNLVGNYPEDFVLTVWEAEQDHRGRRAAFHSCDGFRPHEAEPVAYPDGVLVQEAVFRVRYTTLDHRIPSLAFLLEEERHVNVMRNRLAERGLPVGPWLQQFKRALLDRAPATTRISVPTSEGERSLTLAELADVATVIAGQKIGYVTDAAPTAENARRIVESMGGADLLFIETPFMERDRLLAEQKGHLTAALAGRLAREAGVKRVESFHHSARYRDSALLQAELQTAFAGQPPSSSEPSTSASGSSVSSLPGMGPFSGQGPKG